MNSKFALFNVLLLVPTLLCTWTFLESPVSADSASKLNLGIWLPPMTLKLPKFNMPKIKISATIKPRKNQPPLKIHLPEVSLNAKALGDDDHWGHGGGGGGGRDGGGEGYGGGAPGGGGYEPSGHEPPSGHGGGYEPSGSGYAARSNEGGYSNGGGGYAAASNERYRPTATSGYSAEPAAPTSGSYGSSNNYASNNGGGYNGNSNNNNANSYGSSGNTASSYGGSSLNYAGSNNNNNGGRYTTGNGYSNEQPVTIHQHQPQYQQPQSQYQQPANQYSSGEYRQAEPRPAADEYSNSGYGSRLAPQPSTSYEATRSSSDYGDGPSGYGYAVSPQKRSYPTQGERGFCFQTAFMHFNLCPLQMWRKVFLEHMSNRLAESFERDFNLEMV